MLRRRGTHTKCPYCLENIDEVVLPIKEGRVIVRGYEFYSKVVVDCPYCKNEIEMELEN